jgi:hypothetical protein
MASDSALTFSFFILAFQDFSLFELTLLSLSYPIFLLLFTLLYSDVTLPLPNNAMFTILNVRAVAVDIPAVFVSLSSGLELTELEYESKNILFSLCGDGGIDDKDVAFADSAT